MSSNTVLLLLALVCLAVGNSVGHPSDSKREDFPWINSLLIYKGTKWCGLGSLATSYDDLGVHRETDKCCREHDVNCKARIGPFRKKYDKWNWSWKTSSHCDCETKFKDCLKRVESDVSRRIDDIYFNKLKPRCFRFNEDSGRAYYVELGEALA